LATLAKKHTRLWSVVKKLILQHHEILLKRTIRGSYYIVGDYLGLLINKEITMDEMEQYLKKKVPEIAGQIRLQTPELLAKDKQKVLVKLK